MCVQYSIKQNCIFFMSARKYRKKKQTEFDRLYQNWRYIYLTHDCCGLECAANLRGTPCIHAMYVYGSGDVVSRANMGGGGWRKNAKF